MPRTPRLEVEGGIHHLVQRENRGQRMFRDARDYSFYVAEFQSTARRHGWVWLSYCLMPNHCHLVVETPQTTLGAGMRELGTRHVQFFNRRYGTFGHLYQERYRSVLVRSEEQFAQLLRYVALNPVKAGLCTDPTDWRWSSHRAMLEDRPEARGARSRVESLLEPWGGAYGARYETLFDPSNPVARKFGAESPWTHRPPLEELLRSRPIDDGIRAAREHGYRLSEIAAITGLHVSTISRRAKRGGRAKKGSVPGFAG